MVLQVAVLHEMELWLHSPSVEAVVEATTSQQCVPLDEPRKFTMHSRRTGPLQMKSMLVEDLNGLGGCYYVSMAYLNYVRFTNQIAANRLTF